jgi:hypothetical protein
MIADCSTCLIQWHYFESFLTGHNWFPIYGYPFRNAVPELLVFRDSISSTDITHTKWPMLLIYCHIVSLKESNMATTQSYETQGTLNAFLEWSSETFFHTFMKRLLHFHEPFEGWRRSVCRERHFICYGGQKITVLQNPKLYRHVLLVKVGARWGNGKWVVWVCNRGKWLSMLAELLGVYSKTKWW